MSDEHYDRPIKVPDDVEAETYAILDGLFREYMDTIEEEGNEVNANSSPIELIDDFVVWLKAMQDMQGGSVQAPWAYVQVSVPLMKGTTGEWHEINNAVILLAERFHGVCVLIPGQDLGSEISGSHLIVRPRWTDSWPSSRATTRTEWHDVVRHQYEAPLRVPRKSGRSVLP